VVTEFTNSVARDMATTHVNEGRPEALRTRVRFPAPPPCSDADASSLSLVIWPLCKATASCTFAERSDSRRLHHLCFLFVVAAVVRWFATTQLHLDLLPSPSGFRLQASALTFRLSLLADPSGSASPSPSTEISVC
jgi:hypothetical protein